jgi:hypothetical protein
MRKKRLKQRKKIHHRIMDWSRGNITMTLLIGIVIVGSVMMVSGIFPKNEISKKDPNAPHYKANVTGVTNKKSLQLRTIGFQACSSISAVDLLVDYSGSMGEGHKVPAMHDAINTFTSKLTDDSVIALHIFSDDRVQGKMEIVPFSEWKDVKSLFPSKINSLSGPIGSTWTRSALVYIKAKIADAQKKWPDHKFTLILLTDGIPEKIGSPVSKQCGIRGFAIQEDPTQPPNVADDIKAMGVNIFTIAILDKSDTCFNDDLSKLMKNVASPDSFYSTYNPDDLKTIYSNIVFQVCKEAN